MSGHPQQLAFQKVPTYRQILLHQLYASPCVMSFDPVTTELVTWFWYVPLPRRHLDTFQIFHRPVNGQQLVPLSALRDHRDHHQFLGPSCLCPLTQSLSEEPVFKEAAIYIPVFGPFAGEYVAECVESRCGYLG